MGTLIHGFGEADLLADRAKKDENGNSLTLTIEEDKVTEIGGKSIGGGSSISITETTLGGIKDSNNNDILDSNNETIGDSNSVTFVSGINDKSLLADRAKKDENGNSLTLTIEEDKVTEIGGKSIGGESDIPEDGDAGQVLTKTLDGFGWEDAPVPDPELPDNGIPGQVLTKTQDGVAWSDPESASLPVATESDSVLFTAEPNGEAAWVQMEKTVYGSIMTNEEGTPILDEEGKTIQDEDTATLWTGFNGKGFGAERAVSDENGNNIVATYATKADVETALGDIETLLAAI